MSAGIVSAVGRRGSDLGLPGGGDFIQTDAACNSGSSGGPLVNVQGEVIGISNMTAVAADGVSFAIPIDSARAVIDRVQPLTFICPVQLLTCASVLCGSRMVHPTGEVVCLAPSAELAQGADQILSRGGARPALLARHCMVRWRARTFPRSEDTPESRLSRFCRSQSDVAATVDVVVSVPTSLVAHEVECCLGWNAA